jgi:hypothetical protein
MIVIEKKGIKEDMSKRKAILVEAVAAIVLCFISYYAYGFLASETIHTGGTVSSINSNMEIYEDAACTTPLVSINWGNAAPGSNITKHVWLKNVLGNLMTLSFTTSAWIPSHTIRYLHLTWTGDGQTLASSSPALDTVLTLTIDANVINSSPMISDFSFNITLTGKE